ncbi:MAG: hypothetical protein PUD60_01690 [Akkermansia muciniphila]|nr:hypothetical protein [Akkermansia muciniphila]
MAEHFKLFPGHGNRAPARGCHAALGLHEIQERGNCTNSKEVLRFYRKDLTPPEEVKLEISNVIQEAASHPYIALNVVYFVPDARKSGGSYAEACGTIKKLGPIERLIILNDGTRIPIDTSWKQL